MEAQDLQTFPELPAIFLFKDEKGEIWIGWTVKRDENHLINHQYRLDTPERLMEVAEGFGWEYDGPGDHGAMLDAQEHLEAVIENETDRDTGEPPEKEAIEFPIGTESRRYEPLNGAAAYNRRWPRSMTSPSAASASSQPDSSLIPGCAALAAPAKQTCLSRPSAHQIFT